MESFNPNAPGIANGNFFGLPFSAEQAELLLIQVPWDVTTSYRPGTSAGPQSILNASLQVDLFDFFLEKAWENPVATLPLPDEILAWNQALRPLAEEVISLFETGADEFHPEVASRLLRINQGSERLNQWVFETTEQWSRKGKISCIIGGDHSVPLGLIRLLARLYPGMGILHIDAHADLRKSYEGFEYSHASIMYNALKEKGISKLVQVAVRDVCDEEMHLAASDHRIKMYDGYGLAFEELSGTPFSEICENIISHLPENVYISFDIDGLDPALCPNTGTPVPGGLSFQQAVLLLHMLATSGRKIIGFDLCEVAPGPENDWDANVGARILQKLCNLTRLSHHRS